MSQRCRGAYRGAPACVLAGLGWKREGGTRRASRLLFMALPRGVLWHCACTPVAVTRLLYTDAGRPQLVNALESRRAAQALTPGMWAARKTRSAGLLAAIAVLIVGATAHFLHAWAPTLAISDNSTLWTSSGCIQIRLHRGTHYCNELPGSDRSTAPDFVCTSLSVQEPGTALGIGLW